MPVCLTLDLQLFTGPVPGTHFQQPKELLGKILEAQNLVAKVLEKLKLQKFHIGTGFLQKSRSEK